MPLLQNKRHAYDPTWHVQIIMVIAASLQLVLPNRFVFGVYWLIPGLELVLAVLLGIATPHQRVFDSILRRAIVIGLIAVTALGNVYALIGVANRLLESGQIDNGRALILTAINIYLTNIIIFALLYWEMDGGGPGKRHAASDIERDFLFPQGQISQDAAWRPTYIDYLYVSCTNATAFSPTDTLPLSRRAKMLMLVQSLVSLIVVALVAARAVNILK